MAKFLTVEIIQRQREQLTGIIEHHQREINRLRQECDLRIEELARLTGVEKSRRPASLGVATTVVSQQIACGSSPM